MVDLLPEIEVVAEDAFNSHPTDTKLMGPDALQRHRNGEQLPMVRVKTPLVRIASPNPSHKNIMGMQLMSCFATTYLTFCIAFLSVHLPALGVGCHLSLLCTQR